MGPIVIALAVEGGDARRWEARRMMIHGRVGHDDILILRISERRGGCTHVVHGPSLNTKEPRIPTVPGRTSGNKRPGIQLRAPSAKRRDASHEGRAASHSGPRVRWAFLCMNDSVERIDTLSRVATF